VGAAVPAALAGLHFELDIKWRCIGPGGRSVMWRSIALLLLLLVCTTAGLMITMSFS
jgi:hypothetical protein